MLVADYKEKNGAENLINIGSGEPDTTPPIALKKLVNEEILTDNWYTHTYQDNRSKNNLNQNLIKLNTGLNVDDYSHLSTLILP
jgi:aspartate/methionine/tyrosine aminotransferase